MAEQVNDLLAIGDGRFAAAANRSHSGRHAGLEAIDMSWYVASFGRETLRA